MGSVVLIRFYLTLRPLQNVYCMKSFLMRNAVKQIEFISTTVAPGPSNIANVEKRSKQSEEGCHTLC